MQQSVGPRQSSGVAQARDAASAPESTAPSRPKSPPLSVEASTEPPTRPPHPAAQSSAQRHRDRGQLSGRVMGQDTVRRGSDGNDESPPGASAASRHQSIDLVVCVVRSSTYGAGSVQDRWTRGRGRGRALGLDSRAMASDEASALRLQRDVDPAKDHVRGRGGDDAVTVVSYGDFLCPYCRRLIPVLARLREALGDRLVYVFRHFPNERAHPGAELVARAAEAAGEAGQVLADARSHLRPRAAHHRARAARLRPRARPRHRPVHGRHAQRRGPEERRGRPRRSPRKRSDGYSDALRGRRALRRGLGLLLAPRVARSPRGGAGQARGPGVREPPGVGRAGAAARGGGGGRNRELAARRRLPCRSSRLRSSSARPGGSR